MQSLAAELGKRHDGPEVSHVPAVDELVEPLLSTLAYGDAVMVKGSKGVRLASLVQKIRERF